MKQGKATTSGMGSTKREPISHAVSPGGVSQLGEMVGTRRAVEQIYVGYGYKAPMGSGTTVHRSGTQGKHK